jgi:hypothetical protein
MNDNMNNIINISSDNISGKCDYKCSYTYAYLNTNIVANKNTNMITLINKGIEPVVTYNNNSYMVSSTMIVSPSLHKFNNKKTDGEILIEHMPIQGGQKMYVCIPITQSTTFSNASVIISMIIESVKSSALAENDRVTVNDTKFNLNSFVPQGQFYSYSGYDLNNDVSNFVVFGIENTIPMSQIMFNSLTEIIQPISAQMKGGSLFLNEKGPNSSSSSSSSRSTSASVTPIAADNPNLFPFIDSDTISSIIQIILNCLFFFAIFYIINFLFNYLLSGVNPKIYSVT